MISIQISSDPYKRKITYDRVDGEQLIAIDSSIWRTDPRRWRKHGYRISRRL